MDLIFINFILLPLIAGVIVAFLNKHSKLANAICITVFAYNLLYILNNILITKTAFYTGLNMLSGIMLITIALVALTVSIFSYFAESTKRKGIYYALMLIMVAGMNGIVSTGDFFSIYIFLEVVAVSSFALIAFYNNPLSTEGAIKYFYLSAFASILIILSISLLFVFTGDTSFTALQTAMASNATNPTALNVILGIMVLGFMVKTGLVPFHTWTPDAYQGASTSVSAILAGVVTKAAGAYMLIRIAISLGIINAGIKTNSIGFAIMVFGLITILVGAIAALKQNNFKRMLAFSSVSQMGYIALACGLATPLALAGAVFHLFNHATFKTPLFFNAAALEKQAGSCDIDKIKGLGTKMPYTAWSSIIAMLSTAGMPPLSGFWSKVLIIAALWEAGFHTFAIIALFASLLTLAYFINFQRTVFFGKLAKGLENVKEVNYKYLLPVFVFVILIVVIGLAFTTTFENFIEPFIRFLT